MPVSTDQVSEAFDKFEKLNKAGLLNNMIEFVLYADPPILEVLTTSIWKNEHFTANNRSLQRIANLLGPNGETIYRVWRVKRKTFKGRLSGLVKKPCYFFAFLVWFVGDVVSSSWNAVGWRIGW